MAAFVAVSYAEEPASRKLDPVNEAEPSQAEARDKRGFVLSAYTAPAAVAPAYAAAYTAPVAAAYTGLPYAYSAYSAYSPYASYYGYPAVYV